jgi:hypothetical protein
VSCTSIRPSTACKKTSSISAEPQRCCVQLHNREEVTLSLRKDGEGPVTADSDAS